jgi:hypothetical protein
MGRIKKASCRSQKAKCNLDGKDLLLDQFVCNHTILCFYF